MPKREFIIVPLEVETKGGEAEGVVEGYASTFGNLDSYDDRIEKGAFKKTLKEKKAFPMLWQHLWTQPVGLLKGEEDDHGLMIESKLTMAVEKARDAWHLVNDKVIKGLSIGFEAIKMYYEEDPDTKKRIRVLKEIRLWEVSLVTFAANPLAQVTDVRNMSSNFAAGVVNDFTEFIRDSRLAEKASQDELVAAFSGLRGNIEKGMDEHIFSQLINIMGSYGPMELAARLAAQPGETIASETEGGETGEPIVINHSPDGASVPGSQMGRIHDAITAALKSM